MSSCRLSSTIREARIAFVLDCYI